MRKENHLNMNPLNDMGKLTGQQIFNANGEQKEKIYRQHYS